MFKAHSLVKKTQKKNWIWSTNGDNVNWATIPSGATLLYSQSVTQTHKPVWVKTQDTLLMSITSRNSNRFQNSAENFIQNDRYISHHTLRTLPHYPSQPKYTRTKDCPVEVHFIWKTQVVRKNATTLPQFSKKRDIQNLLVSRTTRGTVKNKRKNLRTSAYY